MLPQVLIIFSRKTPWLLGKPTILGNPQYIGALLCFSSRPKHPMKVKTVYSMKVKTVVP